MLIFPERDPKALDLQIQNELSGDSRPPPHEKSFAGYIFRVPWWAVVMILIGVTVYYAIAASDLYSVVFEQVSKGIEITVKVTIISYLGAIIIGLTMAVIRSTTPRPRKGFFPGLMSILHLMLHNFATFFVEVMRGLPILVVLLLAAYIITPEFRDFMEARFDIDVPFRGQSVETAIIALAMAYGAFLSEIFRAGIESIEKGQTEAAKSLGMTNWQVMRLVILPQAVRRVMPPLGNDFIAMIKDSSLVGYIGIRDLTQSGYLYAGSNFRFLETYLTVAVLYLTLTLIGSLLVRVLERRMGTKSH